jgi:hypothetical protein
LFILRMFFLSTVRNQEKPDTPRTPWSWEVGVGVGAGAVIDDFLQQSILPASWVSIFLASFFLTCGRGEQTSNELPPKKIEEGGALTPLLSEDSYSTKSFSSPALTPPSAKRLSNYQLKGYWGIYNGGVSWYHLNHHSVFASLKVESLM